MINNSNKLNWNLMKNNSMQQKKIYRGINNLRTFLDLTGYWLSEVLKVEGCGNMIGRLFTNNTEIIDVCKTTNRGVLGSMNDMVTQFRFYFSEYQLFHYIIIIIL
jgi:hypothetical protein